jgi:hypothetical protein
VLLRELGHSFGVTEPHLQRLYRKVIPTGLATRMLDPRSIKLSVTEC